jgi:hypothetical protein
VQTAPFLLSNARVETYEPRKTPARSAIRSQNRGDSATLPMSPGDQAHRNHRTHDESTGADLFSRKSAVRVNRMAEDGCNGQGHDHGYDHVSETRVESFHHIERSPQQRPDRLRKMPDPFDPALFHTFIGKHQRTIRAREDDASTAEAEFQAGDFKLAETVRALTALPSKHSMSRRPPPGKTAHPA